MIFCFFLFAGTLLEGKHNGRKVFYQKKPPAVAAAKNSSMASKYIGQLSKKIGSESGGVLVSRHPAKGKKYKIFIAGKTSASPEVLQYFVDLFEKRKGIFKDVSTASTVARDASSPAVDVDYGKIRADYDKLMEEKRRWKLFYSNTKKAQHSETEKFANKICNYVDRLQEERPYVENVTPALALINIVRKDFRASIASQLAAVNNVLEQVGYKKLKLARSLNKFSSIGSYFGSDYLEEDPLSTGISVLVEKKRVY